MGGGGDNVTVSLDQLTDLPPTVVAAAMAARLDWAARLVLERRGPELGG